MTEWLTLLVLIPAVVVPVVLLAGFAGCSFNVSASGLYIQSALGNRRDAILLTWTYSKSDAEKFEITRKLLPNGDPETLEKLVSEVATQNEGTFRLDDGGLLPTSTYEYRVTAIHGDGERFSSVAVNGTTLGTTFEWTPQETVRDSTTWEGFTLVQRIEANRLSASGTRVSLTLRATSAGASIRGVYISRVDPTPGSDPFDSAADITAVTVLPFDVPGTGRTLDAIEYALDESQPLLIAVDFSAAPPLSAVIATDNVTPPDQALAYFKQAPANQTPNEASLRDRTGFMQAVGIRLIERIDVG
jgi:hypothetical protein